MTKIRTATPADAAAIADIYNEAVENGTAIWNRVTVDADNRTQWLRDRHAGGFPVLVSVAEDDTVTGYASYGAFRPFDGYHLTVELSLYVHADRRGQGLGRALLAALVDHARTSGRVHVMVAAIDASNAASIALHEKHGFALNGTLPQVGTKFGLWLDLAFMTLQLDTGDAPAELEG